MDADTLSKLTVPQLKKLLTEKGLTTSGVKADLIQRLQETESTDAAPAAAPVDTTAAAVSQTAVGGGGTAAAAPPAAESEPEPQPLDVEAELAKQEARAKRFGMDDEESAKRLERAKRFGIPGASNGSALDKALGDGNEFGAARRRGRGRGRFRGGPRQRYANSRPSGSVALKFDEEQESKRKERLERFG